ncbi:hypothetical protein ACQ4PT_048047 [Festuca glaucescens]
MAAGGGSGGGGSRRHWLAEDPGFRSGMLRKLTTRLTPYFEPRYDPYSQEAQRFVSKFEEEAFSGANSKVEYMRNISNKLLLFEKRRSEEIQRRMQSRSQLQRTNAPQALQGGNSSVMPEAVMMASPRPTSQPMTPKTPELVGNQHMDYPCTPNMHIEIEKKHPDMMAIRDRCLNFQPYTGLATIGPGVQPSLRPMQLGASQSQSQYPSKQLQAINFVGCSPTSVSKPAIQPNSQQNRLLGKNDSANGRQQLTRMNQQTLGANQQEMDLQRYHILGAQQADASKMQVGQLGGKNKQQDSRLTDLLHSQFKASEPEHMTRTLQQISGAQQSTFVCQNSQIPATIGSAREYDLIEKMYCQIKSWKDAYYLQIVELEERVGVPVLTEEQLLSLPRSKANSYRQRAGLKKQIRKILNFLQLRKSDVHEGLRLEFTKYEKYIHNLVDFIKRTKAHDGKMNIGYQLQNCAQQSAVINLTENVSPITGDKSRQQKQPADASILQSRQTTTARTSPAHQHNNCSHLLGITSPSSISSPGSLQSWSTSMLEYLTPSPVAKPGVAPDSPCAPVMSTFSKDVDSISDFLLHDNAAAPPPKANSSNHVTPTKPMSASSLQTEIAAGQAEDQVRGRDGTSVTKKPIDSLIDAMRSSSPAALRSSSNSIWSVLSISDIVPPGKIGTILDCKSSQQQQFGGSNTVNKMKRVFNNTASCSESLLAGSFDSSCMSFECDASDSGSSSEISIKRQKTMNANDALLEEIKSINSTLIDTVISMSGDCETDGVASCGGGTTLKLSYNAVSISPAVISLFATSETSLVFPAKLFVPPDYPSSSPVLINDGGDEVLRKNSSAISVSLDLAFRHVLADLPEPRSIKEIARAWDACVRKAVTEFAHRQGGGTVSMMLGRWDRCAAA